jgi:hypothetical protein
MIDIYLSRVILVVRLVASGRIHNLGKVCEQATKIVGGEAV